MTDDYLDRLIDAPALAAFLSAEFGPADRFEYRRLDAGHSNETLVLAWGERDLVLRRPPPGETAETAHDVLRECRVQSALTRTEVPVAHPVCACEDTSVIGSEFYLMERLEGDVIRHEEPERFASTGARQHIGDELVEVLAAIHGVNYEAIGLGGFGYPDGYTRRQVDRWSQQLMWAFERTASVREVPDLYEVGAWLAENVPASYPHTLVHGDYKLDNVMFAPGQAPEIVGVFDWEMSTLGDPRADIGWMLSYWREPADAAPVAPDLTPTFMESRGYPSRRELVDRYEERTGRAYEHDRFYRALAVYKLAALGEMFFRRHLEGNSADPTYPRMEERVPHLAARALRIIDGDEPL